MKKGILLTIVFILFGAGLLAQEYDIRKLKWWMSYDKVVKAEKLEDSLFKEDILLDAKVEVIFGINQKGLYSVTYNTQDSMFAENVIPKLDKKYGPSRKELDYTFLMVQTQNLLKKYPQAVLNIMEKQDYSDLATLDISYEEKVNLKKILKNGLTPHSYWEGETTSALLFEDNDTVLSYRPKSFHYENKKTFELLLAQIRKDVAAKKKKDASDENL